MRSTSKYQVNLTAAIQSIAEHQAQELTLLELVKAYDVQICASETYRLRKWIEALGALSAWEITTDQLSAAAQAMVDAGYKASTPNRDLSALGTIYRWAIRRKLPPTGFKSPTIGARRFKEDIRRVYVTDAEILALRNGSLAYKDRRFGVFVNLLLDSGARKSEIYERKWDEVNLEKREILLPTSKNGTPRTLHFSESTLQLMLRVFPKREITSFIFEGLVPNQPISYRAAWNLLVKNIGRPDLRLHDCRHIVAAGMLRNGVSLPIAAQAIGNSPTVLAMRYGHLETGTLKQAVASQWKTQSF
jgi:integrase